MLRNHLTRGCLDGNGNVAYISVCGDGNVFQRWDAVGVNGHVIFRHRKTNTCIQPYVVWESLRLVPCTYWNVQAWDYFR